MSVDTLLALNYQPAVMDQQGMEPSTHTSVEIKVIKNITYHGEEGKVESKVGAIYSRP